MNWYFCFELGFCLPFSCNFRSKLISVANKLIFLKSENLEKNIVNLNKILKCILIVHLYNFLIFKH